MSEHELTEHLADALRPLAQFVTDNIHVIENAANAYNAWGIGWLEALANGYIDEGADQ